MTDPYHGYKVASGAALLAYDAAPVLDAHEENDWCVWVKSVPGYGLMTGGRDQCGHYDDVLVCPPGTTLASVVAEHRKYLGE
jgi:hypothetical protein